MRNVRIFFEKKELAKYISHLDLMRCFSRAFKRADIAIWYTEGFNPHAFMTFSQPLSLGVESYCESVDIRITDEMSNDEIVSRLNETLPQGIFITKAAEPVYKAEEIAFAKFNITFYTLKNEKIKSELENALAADDIPAEKKAKQGRKKVIKQINLKELIHSYSVAAFNDNVVVSAVLSAGLGGNLNPSLLIESITKNFTDDIDDVKIEKLNMFTAEMKEFE